MAINKNAFQRYRIIDNCIRSVSKPFPSKKDLKRACEEELFGTESVNICDSTIEKDIKYMREEHEAPICYSRLNNGYYYSDKKYSLNQMPLSDTDIETVKTAINILKQFKHSSLFSKFETAIDKISNRINISKNVQDLAIDKYVQFETNPKIGGSEYLEKILEAIKNKNIIQFGYKSYQSNEGKIRRIQPYLLKEYKNRWYLIGKSELKNKILTFGLDRIYDIEILSTVFKQDPSFSSDMFFKHSIGITTTDKLPSNIKISTNEILSKYLLSQPIHHSQKFLGEKNGEYIFTYYLLQTYELRMQILSFGEEARVIEPKELVEEIKEINKKVLEKY